MEPLGFSRSRAVVGAAFIEFLLTLPILLALLLGVIGYSAYALDYQRYLRVATSTTERYLRTEMLLPSSLPPSMSIEQWIGWELLRRISAAAALESIPGSTSPPIGDIAAVAARVTVNCVRFDGSTSPSCGDRPLLVVVSLSAPRTGALVERFLGVVPSVTHAYPGLRMN
jgi:hypothetical protein